MPPFQAGIFIYAKNPEELSEFYQAVLGMTIAARNDQMCVLQSPDFQIIVHAMPPQVAAEVTITRPPQVRDHAAVKFFYTVQRLANAEVEAHSRGGEVFPEQWQGPGFIVRNACDSEGNIFQIRQKV